MQTLYQCLNNRRPNISGCLCSRRLFHFLNPKAGTFSGHGVEYCQILI